MHLDLFFLAIGCVALFGGGELLVRGASATGRRFGLSPTAIGLILVSLGTSAPELFVSAGAAIQGYGDIAVGNVVGSNIVNLCIVLGLAVLLADLRFEKSHRQRQLPFLLLLTLAAVALAADGRLERVEGVLLLLGALVGLAWALRGGSSGEAAIRGEDQVEDPDGAASIRNVDADNSAPRAIAVLAGGVVLLAVGAEALIVGGVGLARDLDISEAVIALTVTSIGTGLPEIVATVVAALRRHNAIAMGNVVGSNIMNLGLVLGGSAVLTPLNSSGIDRTTLTILVGLTLLVCALSWWRNTVPRFVGVLLLLAYAAYVFVLAG